MVTLDKRAKNSKATSLLYFEKSIKNPKLNLFKFLFASAYQIRKE